MPEDFGPTGIDPDWYDHGPGSEAWKRKRAREQMKRDNEAFARRMRNNRIVKAAEEETEAERYVHEVCIKLTHPDEDESSSVNRQLQEHANNCLHQARDARREAVRGEE